MVARISGLMAGVLAIALAGACSSSSPNQSPAERSVQEPAAKKQITMTTPTNRLSVERLATVPISSTVATAVMEIGPPPGASMLEVPGPRRKPARPYLALGSSLAGLAARVVQPDGTATPTLVLGAPARTVTVPAAPKAVAGRSDGAWVLYLDRLSRIDLDGTELHSTHVSGITVLADGNGDAWVVGLDSAWRVNAAGEMRGPYPWRGAHSSVVASGGGDTGGALCALDHRGPRALRCLGADGSEREDALSAPPQALEQLVAVDRDRQRAITRQGSIVRLYEQSGLTGSWNIQSAGLDDRGRGFLSTHAEGAVQIAIASDEARVLPLPDDAPAAMGAVTLAGASAVVYGRDRAYTFTAGSMTGTSKVDHDYYRDTLFPRLWTLAMTDAVGASSDGRLLLSATGPDGMVILAVATSADAKR